MLTMRLYRVTGVAVKDSDGCCDLFVFVVADAAGLWQLVNRGG